MPYNSQIDRTDAAQLIPEDVQREIVQEAGEASAVLRMAKRLPNMSRKQRRIPVVSVLPVAYFVSPGGSSDTGLKQTTEMNWDGVYITAEELAVIVPIPEAVLDDTDYDMWAEIRPAVVDAFGKAIDQAILYGTNKPSTWPTGIVTDAIAHGHNVAKGTGADLYDDLLGEGGTLAKLEADGYMATGHLAAVAMRSALRGVRSSDGVPLFKATNTGAGAKFGYELDGAPLDFPKNGGIVPATSLLVSGDWDRLVYAIRQDITFKILDQAVIQDNTGAIVYNLAQNDMVALRAVMRLGWALPNPVNNIEPTAGNRYPFAVLTP